VCVLCSKSFIVDPGRGGTPAYMWCRQAKARFSLLQLLLLLLQTSPAAGCLCPVIASKTRDVTDIDTDQERTIQRAHVFNG
jgi:hypothetical protein